MLKLTMYWRVSFAALVLLPLVAGCNSPKAETRSTAGRTNSEPAQIQKDSWSISKLYENDKLVQLVRIHENPSAKQSDFPLLFEVHGRTKGEAPNSQEFDQFAAAENAVEKLENAGKCVLMVCTTGKGERTWYYYGKTLENAKEIAIAMQAFKPKIDASPDPEWNCYHGYIELRKRSAK